MTDQQGPDWARGLAAIAVLLLIVGFFVGIWIMLVGGLLLLFVGAATANQRRAGGKPPETLLNPGDRPWRRAEDED
ncbi:hypothetical protein AB0D29_33110 [Streptomyces sp. NPDC048424]|uniref:hypothetical protein n=1 Tax=Streptomyces sp. NPDC048424 TaxID=3155265 RepID=UPI00343628CA